VTQVTAEIEASTTCASQRNALLLQIVVSSIKQNCTAALSSFLCIILVLAGDRGPRQLGL
jgi:hypothetical protein